ncbi:hypothetical protein FGO68_gene10081 [Halteria grandinella]|uniref:Uncharacterized protein n=1 Tax=Halteria grandinella TaxID=5974 RepID=A0A8J8NDI7_HALGN|nr:hypothetical protein FGO68_gene10081 [Halteria grandinella]
MSELRQKYGRERSQSSYLKSEGVRGVQRDFGRENQQQQRGVLLIQRSQITWIIFLELQMDCVAVLSNSERVRSEMNVQANSNKHIQSFAFDVYYYPFLCLIKKILLSKIHSSDVL